LSLNIVKKRNFMEKTAVKRVLSILPPAMSGEIRSILSGRLGGEDKLSELRVIKEGVCSIVHNREMLALSYTPTSSETEQILSKACSGGVYAFRDTIRRGYVSLGEGIRLGVSGVAAYDEGKLVGISHPRSLIFRLPTYHCDFCDKLISIYRRGIGKGMLIYSPPAIGKTTALRALAEVVSREKRLCIVDERGELDGSKLPYASVLSGYEKALGIEIALRTHSPEIIMVDELGTGEADALSEVLGAGIPVIATAHGGDINDLLSRSGTSWLIKNGFFDVLVGISYKRDKYRLRRDLCSEVLPCLKT
jgi:stage III sporulation protein AA